jgi:hypothetical protein
LINQGKPLVHKGKPLLFKWDDSVVTDDMCDGKFHFQLHNVLSGKEIGLLFDNK